MSHSIHKGIQQYPIILASNSPRRREILTQVDIPYTVMVSEIEEVITKQEPEQVVMELASQKAMDVAKKVEEGTILAADTVVSIHGKILGKPKSEEDAYAMLMELSNCAHSVFTGVCIISKKEGVIVDNNCFYEETNVYMREIEEEEVLEYIKSNEPFDKAGSYGIQGRAAAFIERIEGDYYNVVGLPIARVVKELKKEKRKT